MIHPSTLEYSSQPPVSVYGTSYNTLTLERFLGGHYVHYQIARRLSVLSHISILGGFAYRKYTFVV